MVIKKNVVAGSLDSSDVLITLSPSQDGKLTINISSPFIRQFGNEIKTTAKEILQANNITSCVLTIQDQGAMKEVLVARITTAIERSCSELNLGGLDE